MSSPRFTYSLIQVEFNRNEWPLNIEMIFIQNLLVSQNQSFQRVPTHSVHSDITKKVSLLWSVQHKECQFHRLGKPAAAMTNSFHSIILTIQSPSAALPLSFLKKLNLWLLNEELKPLWPCSVSPRHHLCHHSGWFNYPKQVISPSQCSFKSD